MPIPIPILQEESPDAVDVPGAAVPGPFLPPDEEVPPSVPTILARRAPAENSLFTWFADALDAVDGVGPGESWGEDSAPFRALSNSPVLDREAETAAGMWHSTREGPRSRANEGPAEPPMPFLDPRAREEVVRAVLSSALPQFPRVILFGAGEYGVVAWGGRGRNLTSDRVAAIRVPRGERSLFSSVEAWSPHFGAVKRDDWHASLAFVLGASPRECAVFAIRFLECTVGYLYADRLGERMRREDFSLVARAAAASADVFSRAARRGSVTRV